MLLWHHEMAAAGVIMADIARFTHLPDGFSPFNLLSTAPTCINCEDDLILSLHGTASIQLGYGMLPYQGTLFD